MLVTEKQAAGMICPQTCQRLGETEAGLCLGPRCMAWRWREWTRPSGDVVFVRMRDSKPLRGFCGLAGTAEE